MSGTVTWDEHEAWLARFLEPLDGEHPAAPMLLSFNGGRADWLVDSRLERPDEPVDPLTELAVLVGELRPEAAVVALPVRVSDLDAPGRPVLARTWTLTSAVRRGHGAELRVRQLAVDNIGPTTDVDVEMSPIASVLDDAIRHRRGEEPTHALYTAARWGHTLYAAGVDESVLDRPPTSSPAAHAGRAADAARHRLQRHARDLALRHRPLAGWDQVFDRPAVHATTPDGWEPACPV